MIGPGGIEGEVKISSQPTCFLPLQKWGMFVLSAQRNLLFSGILPQAGKEVHTAIFSTSKNFPAESSSFLTLKWKIEVRKRARFLWEEAITSVSAGGARWSQQKWVNFLSKREVTTLKSLYSVSETESKLPHIILTSKQMKHNMMKIMH